MNRLFNVHKASDSEAKQRYTNIDATAYADLATFANNLDSDQDQRSGPNQFGTLIVFLKYFLEKVNFEKVSRRQKPRKITQHANT